LFLNQLLEEYIESENKDEVFDKFIRAIWKSTYRFQKYKKRYTFKVNENLLDNRISLIDLFNAYNNIEYTVVKSFYGKANSPIDYIRIHINNMYGYLFDNDVYYDSEYYKLLITPKKEYFKAINSVKEGIDVDYIEIKNSINVALKNAEILKNTSVERKKNMKFIDYKKIINAYLRRIFDNYTPIHEYEEKHGWEMRVNVDGWSENNYIIKYFCKSLSGYMRHYIRDSKKEQKKCKVCDILVENNRSYCTPCYTTYRKKYKADMQKKYRTKNVDS
jgi:hypothetical protein